MSCLHRTAVTGTDYLPNNERLFAVTFLYATQSGVLLHYRHQYEICKNEWLYYYTLNLIFIIILRLLGYIILHITNNQLILLHI